MSNEKLKDLTKKRKNDEKLNPQLVDVLVNSLSTEDLVCNYIADLDINQNKNEDFFLEKVYSKLIYTFNKKNLTTAPKVKNKYYYFTTIGAINYLEAIHKLKLGKDANTLSEFEKNTTCKLIADGEVENVRIISLGSGDGKNDIEIISRLLNNSRISKIEYIPIDISSHLLNITIFNYLKKFQGNDSVNIYPILSDFLDLEHYVSKFNPPNESLETYFLLFEQTLANYSEGQLLKELSKLMNAGDKLLTSVKLHTTINHTNDFKDSDLINNYNNIENIEFVISPLKLIPKYRGYLTNLSKYLVFDNLESVLNSSFSDVGKSKTFAPFLYLKHKNGGNGEKIYLTFSTRYDEAELRAYVNSLTKNINIPLSEEIVETDSDNNCIICFKRPISIDLKNKTYEQTN